MRFSDIPGHEQQKKQLANMVDTDRIPHAILLEGPAGVGKFAMARALAQYIHCENRHDGDSCGVCASCRQHQSFNQIDTTYSFPVVKRDSGKPTVSADFLPEFREFITESPFMDYEQWLMKLDNINAQPAIFIHEAQELIRTLGFTSHSQRYKIVLIWLPEKFREDTANKMLKLIEEPYADTVFILTSNAPRQILPTIYSRLRRVKFMRLTDRQIADTLIEREGIAPQEAEQAARLGEGSITEALRLAGESKTRREYLDLFIDLMRKAYSRKVAELKKWALDLAALGRERNMQMYEYTARLIRENFILNIRQPELNFMDDAEAAFSSRFSPYINERNVLGLVQTIDDARADIAANVNAKLVNFDVAVRIILLLKR